MMRLLQSISSAMTCGVGGQASNDVANSPWEAARNAQLASKWGVSAADVAAAFCVASAQYGTGELAIVFLLARGVNCYICGLDSLLNPSCKHSKAMRKWVDGVILVDGDLTPNKQLQSFEDFLQTEAAWSGFDSYVFHVAKGVSVVQRWQRSDSLCFMNAPIVLQHYLVALHQPDVGMIDMTKLIRERFCFKSFEHCLRRTDGVSAETLLDQIFTQWPRVDRIYFQECYVNQDFDLSRRLDKYGPALVSEFVVHSDFYLSRGVRFVGEPRGPIVGLHAMVLIGARRDATGKQWYLLQNWWKDMQFVEMSEEYLKGCEPVISFVEGEQTAIRNGLPVLPFLTAVNDLDLPDGPVFTGPLRPRLV